MIASRGSELAKAQAQAVGRALSRLHSGIKVDFRWIESEGDRRPHAPLATSGGKGLFVRAVENALLHGEADLAVHSLKDIPTNATPGLAIAAVPARGDVRDCLISPHGATIQDLPQNAIVATSSPRRAAQVLRIRPDIHIIAMRGNVETRLRKILEEHMAHATILAVAGLHRSGRPQYADKIIETSQMLPAACQGALAIQCRADDHVSLSRCLPLNNPAAATAVHFEREIVHGLNGDCHSAIGVLAAPAADDARMFTIRALVLSADGQRHIECEGRGHIKELTKVARRMIEDLRSRGADGLLHGPPLVPLAVR